MQQIYPDSSAAKYGLKANVTLAGAFIGEFAAKKISETVNLKVSLN